MGRLPVIEAGLWVRRGAMVLATLIVGLTFVPGPRPTPIRPAAQLSVAAPMGAAFRPGALVRSDAEALPIAVSASELPAVLYGVRTSTPAIALTFDLDMTPGMLADLRAGVVTSWVDTSALSYLQQTHTPATLFMTGMWAEVYPQLARQLAQSGQFEIANHSYSHPAFHHPCYGLGTTGPAGNDWQVTHAQQTIEQITGVQPRFFRFPGGCYDPAAVGAVHRLGLQPVEWTVNSLDAFNHNPGQIVWLVTHRASAGGIVIMHLMGGPNAPETGTALRAIIPALVQRGFRFVTVSQLLTVGPPLPMPPGSSVVEAAPIKPVAPAPTLTPVVRPTPAGYWVWTPWGWQQMSRPPVCRWQLSATYPKHWVCV